jgi:hypothetical protein
MVVARYRTSQVKAGESPSHDREQIVRDMVRNRRHLMIEGVRVMSAFLDKYFRERIGEVCDLVQRRAGKSLHVPQRKATFDIEGLGPEEALWAAALEEVLGDNATVHLIPEYVPIVQSIAAKAHARVQIFLGEAPAPAAPLPSPVDPSAPPVSPRIPTPIAQPTTQAEVRASVNILRRAQDMGRQITRINETTRKQIIREVEKAVEDGATIAETVKAIREKVPQIARSRIPTIARTEVGNAIDHGTKEAVKHSRSVTFVSVVGCQAVEPNIPTFDGRPTCNITNVPSDRVDELRFHPNHTGCIVASGFVNDRR